MSYPDKHLSLGIGVLDLLHLDDFFLVQYFDGVETSVVPGSHKMNASERSGPKTSLSADLA